MKLINVFCCLLIGFSFVSAGLSHAQTPLAVECQEQALPRQPKKAEIIEQVRGFFREEIAMQPNFARPRVTFGDYVNCLIERGYNFSKLSDDDLLPPSEIARLERELKEKSNGISKETNDEPSLQEIFERLALPLETSEENIIAAQIAFVRGESNRAVELAKNAIILDADNYEANYVLARLTSDLAKANRAVALKPDFAPALRLKAGLLLEQYSTLRGAAKQTTRKNLLETLRVLLSLPDLHDAHFWREQQESLIALSNNQTPEATKRTGLPQTSTQNNFKILSKPSPDYTDTARATNTSGSVRLQITFAADGQIKNVLAVKMLPFGLTQQAVSAAKRMTFEPEIKNGKPVSVTKIVEYTFRIY